MKIPLPLSGRFPLGKVTWQNSKNEIKPVSIAHRPFSRITAIVFLWIWREYDWIASPSVNYFLFNTSPAFSKLDAKYLS